MVEFNKIEISEGGQFISLDVKLEDYIAQIGYSIKKIYVEYFKNRNADGTPSALAGIAFSSDAGVTEYSGEFEISVMQKYDPSLTTFSGGMFYIIVECSTASVEEQETVFDTGAVIDWNEVYRVGMSVVARFASKCCDIKCEVPDELEQFVLVWHSLELAMEAQDRDMMERLWSRYISFGHSSNKSSCNCCK